MSIYMIGIDHTAAPVDVRAAFAFTKKHAAQAMEILKASRGILGSLILSTCNRMECWISTADDWDGDLLAEVCQIKGLETEEYRSYFTERKDREAVTHLFYLTSGLKSQILGEDQILTQIKDALSLSREQYCADSVLEVLFRKAVTAGKKVKTEVVFSRANYTAMDQAVEMLKERGFQLDQMNCMVIGNGEMGKLAAQTLRDEGARVTVTVRQYRSGIVNIPSGCQRISYGDRMELFPKCDLVVSATASPNYTLTYDKVRESARKKGLIMIDLAVPRDMEPSLATLEGLELYDIDDFKSSGKTRDFDASMAKASVILQEHMEEFFKWLEGRDLIPRIQDIQRCAVEDLNARIARIIAKLPLEDELKEELTAAIDTSAGKVAGKMIYGLRESMDPGSFEKCIESMEQVYGK